MYVISASYGNDSMALIQWAINAQLKNVIVAYCDTGWAAAAWDIRIKLGEALAKANGFDSVKIQSMGMIELIKLKKGWPGNGQQFCTAHLKGIPFLSWIDEIDPGCKYKVLIGKRQAESHARKDTPEFISNSEYHGGRTIWHPLYMHSDGDRDSLLKQANIEILPHRSQECSPCVNANRSDFMRLTKDKIEQINDLEVLIGKPMFRPKRFKALGIYGVMVWAKHGCKSKRQDKELLDNDECGSPFGCGL